MKGSLWWCGQIWETNVCGAYYTALYFTLLPEYMYNRNFLIFLSTFFASLAPADEIFQPLCTVLLSSHLIAFGRSSIRSYGQIADYDPPFGLLKTKTNDVGTTGSSESVFRMLKVINGSSTDTKLLITMATSFLECISSRRSKIKPELWCGEIFRHWF